MVMQDREVRCKGSNSVTKRTIGIAPLKLVGFKPKCSLHHIKKIVDAGNFIDHSLISFQKTKQLPHRTSVST